MAINFLNNVALNRNELRGAAIENQGTDALYQIRYQVRYTLTQPLIILGFIQVQLWEEVGGGVETLNYKPRNLCKS